MLLVSLYMRIAGAAIRLVRRIATTTGVMQLFAPHTGLEVLLAARLARHTIELSWNLWSFFFPSSPHAA